MSRTLQFKRYANTVVANTTGAAGEIIIETTNNIVTVHTGSVVGGVRMASESLLANSSNIVFTHANAAFNVANVATANISFLYGVDASQNSSINVASNTAQYGFDKANSANVLAQSAYNQGNIAFSHANAAYNLANTHSNNFGVLTQNAQNTNYILSSSDVGKHLYFTQSTAVNLYIPWSSNASFSNGTTIMLASRTTASANVRITPNTGVSLYLAGNTTSASRNLTTYGVATLLQVSSNTWMISGFGVV